MTSTDPITATAVNTDSPGPSRASLRSITFEPMTATAVFRSAGIQRPTRLVSPNTAMARSVGLTLVAGTSGA